MRKWVAGISALFMVLLLAGCTGQDPTAMVQQAHDKLMQVKSVESQMTTVAQYTSNGMESNDVKQYVGQLQVEPYTLAIDFSRDEQPAYMNAYWSKESGQLINYLYSIYNDPDRKNATWLQDKLNENQEASSLNQLDPRYVVGFFLEGMTDVKVAGEEKLGEAKAQKVSGVIRGAALEVALKDSALMSNLNYDVMAKLDEIPEAYEAAGDVPVTVWIDQKSGYPLKVEVDLTEGAKAMIPKMLELSGSRVTDDSPQYSVCTLSVELSQFDQLPPLSVPAEALSAPEA